MNHCALKFRFQNPYVRDGNTVKLLKIFSEPKFSFKYMMQYMTMHSRELGLCIPRENSLPMALRMIEDKTD